MLPEMFAAGCGKRLRFCDAPIALELDMDRTADLIGWAGYVLRTSSKFNLIIMYFIRRGQYGMFTINEALFACDQSLLGA